MEFEKGIGNFEMQDIQNKPNDVLTAITFAYSEPAPLPSAV